MTAGSGRRPDQGKRRHARRLWRAVTKRVDANAKIEDWARRVDDAYLARDMTWFSGAAQREVSATYRLLVTHFFNHLTHHRGQAHALITAAGEKTEDIDLFLVVPRMIA